MRIVVASLCLIALIGPAAAQSGEAPPVLEQVHACSAIAGDSERLACYDAAVSRLQAAQTSGELVAVERTQVQQIQRESFGFALPSLPRLFGGAAQGEAAASDEALQFEVASVRRRADGKAVITMANGQVWAQIDTGSSNRIRQGAGVTIRRAALGSFLLVPAAGGASLRVRREQ